MKRYAGWLSMAWGCAAGTPVLLDPPAPAPVAAAPAAPTTVLAVFDLEDGTQSLSAGDLAQLGDYLGARVASVPGVRVVPRAQLRQALAEAKAEGFAACFDQSCQLELGKAVSAQKSLSTKLLRVGGTCAMTSTLFDLTTEATERSASTRTGCSAEEVMAAVDEVVRQFGGAPSAATAGAPAARAPAPTAAPAPMVAEAPPLELVLDEAAQLGWKDPAATEAKPSARRTRGAPSPPTHDHDLRPTTPGAAWVKRGNTKVRVGPPVRFAEGADTLDATAARNLAVLAQGIFDDPTLGGPTFELVGHAAVSERGARELSERRARAARDVLVRMGHPRARIIVVGAGTSQPVKGDLEAQRCVELRIAAEIGY